MKAVAYSIKPFEKEYLAKANQKKHDITLISNSLSLETAFYAAGKDAVIVFTNDDVTAPVIRKLADMGIKYLVTRSSGIDHIDRDEAQKFKLKLSNVPSTADINPAFLTAEALQEIANQTIKNLDLWQANKCVGSACICAKDCNKSYQKSQAT